ncbi:MAG: ABC transporter ATP-binding protein [Gammaproteobacteria bacterium]|nr:ABC transporter ATP-binding protein [Gammaproteobacteria bacterium]
MSTNTSPDTAHAFSWHYVAALAKAHKPVLIKANIIALLAALVSVPVPLLMPLLVDEVLLHQPGTLVAWMNAVYPVSWHGPALYILSVMLVTVLLRLGSLALSVWQAREFTLVAKDITFHIRRRLLEHMQNISMVEYETLGTGSVASHLVTDVEAVDGFIGSALSKFVVAVLSIAGVAAILLWIHWQLALFILVLNPLVIFFTMVLGKKVKHLKKNENAAFELFQQSLAETLDAIQQIRASNRERHYLLRVIDKARGVRQHSAAFGWKSDAVSRLSFFVFLFGFEMFRAISMVMVVFSDLSIGQMFAVYSYLWFMMTPVQEVLGIQFSYFSANAALGRINRLFALQREPVYVHKHNPFAGQHTVAVSIEHVQFAYARGEPVLNDVSLQIHAGEKVALVGASGGGKSTLVQVLLGLYPPQSGRVCFDGVPTEEIGLDVVREHVATVLQHPALFNDSIRSNLSLGKTQSDDELWQALDIAQLGEFVRELPDALETIVGLNGVRLSGGQRQRLAIARMLLMNPQVVILDEATSMLDSDTEYRLHQAMQAFLQNRTTLIIAHRLSAVKLADRVYVFDGGRIIEQGRHEELVARDGVYRKLYGQRQA